MHPLINGEQMHDAVPTHAGPICIQPLAGAIYGNIDSRSQGAIASSHLQGSCHALRPGWQGDDIVVLAEPDLAGRKIDVDIETYGDHRIARACASGLKIPPHNS